MFNDKKISSYLLFACFFVEINDVSNRKNFYYGLYTFWLNTLFYRKWLLVFDNDYQELVIIKHCSIFMYPRICNPYYLIQCSEFQSILNFLSCFYFLHIFCRQKIIQSIRTNFYYNYQNVYNMYSLNICNWSFYVISIYNNF